MKVCSKRRRSEEVKFVQEEVCPISVSEMQEAEAEIHKYVQHQSFAQEIADLTMSQREESSKTVREKPTAVKKSSSISKLDPVLKNGLLCVGGRLRNAPLPECSRSPPIVPKNHHIGNLIIRYFHAKSGHSGIEYCLSLIREAYWIIGGRVSVKRELNKCFNCRRRQAPLGEQKMSDLPVDR